MNVHGFQVLAENGDPGRLFWAAAPAPPRCRPRPWAWGPVARRPRCSRRTPPIGGLADAPWAAAMACGCYRAAAAFAAGLHSAPPPPRIQVGLRALQFLDAISPLALDAAPPWLALPSGAAPQSRRRVRRL